MAGERFQLAKLKPLCEIRKGGKRYECFSTSSNSSLNSFIIG